MQTYSWGASAPLPVLFRCLCMLNQGESVLHNVQCVLRNVQGVLRNVPEVLRNARYTSMSNFVTLGPLALTGEH